MGLLRMGCAPAIGAYPQRGEAVRNWLRRARARSVLLLQLPLVLGDELPDLVRHVEQLRPLLLIQRDRKATEPVHRQPTLLAHLHRYRPRRTLLQRFVFLAEPLQLGLHIFVGHYSSASVGVVSAMPEANLTM